jgi:SAM-dependent methyltransferase
MALKTCEVCGNQFECGPNEGSSQCWCTELPNIMPYPASGDCLCPDCLKRKIEVVEGYNAVSKMYADKYGDEILLKPVVQRFIGEFASAVPENEVICDVGCGPGQVARYLHNNLYRKSTGIDLSPGMIDMARQLNPEIEFTCADVLQLTAQELYGGIIALYFIVNFPPQQLLLVCHKLYQLLKPDGKLLLSFHIGEDSLHRVESLWDSGKAMNFYFFDPATVTKALIVAGFKVTDIKYRHPDKAIEYESERAYIFAEK